MSISWVPRILVKQRRSHSPYPQLSEGRREWGVGVRSCHGALAGHPQHLLELKVNLLGWTLFPEDPDSHMDQPETCGPCMPWQRGTCRRAWTIPSREAQPLSCTPGDILYLSLPQASGASASVTATNKSPLLFLQSFANHRSGHVPCQGCETR